MTQDFKPFENKNYHTTSMISVSKNSVYFSSKFRKEMNVKPNDYFSFAFIEGSNMIEVKNENGSEERRIKYKIDGKGYCKLRLSSVMPQGRYIFQGKSDLGYIMKLTPLK